MTTRQEVLDARRRAGRGSDVSAERLPDLLPRIRRLAGETRDARETYELAARQRDELIVEAVDAGVSQREVALAAGLSKGRIIAILANTLITEVL